MQTRPRPVKYRRKNKLRFDQKPGKPGLELRPYQVILRPLVTEKGTHQSTRHNAYTFHVNLLATKTDVKMAVLSKIRDNAAVVVDDFGLAAIKTKDMAGILKALSLREFAAPAPAPAAEGETPKKPKKKNLSLLIGTDKLDQMVYKSARNLEGVRVLPASDFNAYEVLRPKRLVLTRAALDTLRAKKG